VALFVALTLTLPLLAAVVWRLTLAGPHIDTSTASPTAEQVLPALERSLTAPNDVTLEVTYALSPFFPVTGQASPEGSALTLFLQEDTHIDALDDGPPRFHVMVDGKGPFLPTEWRILSNSGHHRTSRFTFAPGSVPDAKSVLGVVFLFPDGTSSSVRWQLPLQLAAGGQVAARLTEAPDGASPSVALPSLNRVLRKVKPNVAYAGTQGVELAATFATPEYFRAALTPDAWSRYAPERFAVFMVSEASHTSDLPAGTPPLTLRFQGKTYRPDVAEATVASAHHRVTMVRFPVDIHPGQTIGTVELELPDRSSLSWGLPILYPRSTASSALGLTGASILSLVGGMIAAMWPCLFQLTAFFIPALAGLSMEEANSQRVGAGSRLRVVKAALFFVFGFTLVYTAAGAFLGFAVQRLGNAPDFERWQRYIGVFGGIAIIVLALRTAAKVRAPLVCKMPVLSGMARRRRVPSSPLELMVAGLAFATGCMTCFGAALIIAMVVYVGMAGSAIVGALTLFLFSMGMGIPLVIAAAAMAKVLPTLTKLERIVPWMGLASSLVMVGFAIMLITGNYMTFTNWLLARL
jgi:cytochrome c-type biogenesis protein